MHADPTFPAKYLLLAGMAAPLVYAATVILGGVLTPNYSHVDQAISELTATGASRRRQLEPGFVVYNVLVVLFVVGLLFHTRHWGRLFRWGSLTVGLTGVLGLASTPFPMDPIGETATAAGILHLVTAGFLSVGTMAAMLLFGMGWWSRPDRQTWSFLTLAALAAVFVSGLLAAMAAAQGWPAMGLYERITIGIFLVWMFLTALHLWLEQLDLRR